MNATHPLGSAPKIRPILQDAVIQPAIAACEASSLLLERLHLQDDPGVMLDVVINQLRRTAHDLEVMRQAHPIPVKISRTLAQAHSLEAVVDVINRGGVCEGMEGIEFTAEELAGQYAADAARDNGFLDVESLAAHLEFLSDAGAVFYAPSALEWARTVATALREIDLDQGGRHA